MKLTKRVVDGAQPGGKDVILWDDELRGFGLRIKPAGTKSYIVQYRDESRRTRRLTIGRSTLFTPEQARKEATRLLASVALGANPAQDKRVAKEPPLQLPTVADAAARYLRDYAEIRKKPRSIAEDKRLLERHILPVLGHFAVADITEDDVMALHHELRNTPTQANRTRALLSTILNLCEQWRWRPLGSNPCRLVPAYTEQARDRYLSGKELELLGRAIREAEADGEPWQGLLAVRLLLLTGARVGEILSARWGDVDLQRGVLRLRDSKTGPRPVLLPPAAVALLQQAPRGDSPWVIPGRQGKHMLSLQSQWRRLQRRVDAIQDRLEAEGTLKRRDRVSLAGVRVHDLRHAFASVGAGVGLSLPVLGGLLGHGLASTTERYAHLALDPLRAASDKVAGHIAAVLDGEPEAEVLEFRR